jgi:hypothetical protein
MAAPLRIAQHENLYALSAGTGGDAAKEYLDRLVKLIPGEIVALYLAGKVLINNNFVRGGTQHPHVLSETGAWIAWTLFCLIALILVRKWATSDSLAAVPAEWIAITLAGVSFLVWIYSLGDIFERVLKIWDPLLASLLVLAWTFLSPWFYQPNRVQKSSPENN